MAFLYFKKQKCDLVVLETGLGGETDATNVIKNTVCAVFATISVDHLGWRYPGRDRTDEIRDHQTGMYGSVSKTAGECQTDPAKESRESELYIHRSRAGTDEYRKEDYKGLTFSYKKYAHMQNHIAGEAREKIFLWHWK